MEEEEEEAARGSVESWLKYQLINHAKKITASEPTEPCTNETLHF